MQAAAIAPILTERLELRLLKVDDADALLRFRGRQDATRYLSHEALSAVENTTRLAEQLTRSASSTLDWFHLGWAIVLRASGEIVGDARAWNTAESIGFTKDRYFTATQDSHGKALPSWRYRLDLSATR